MREVKGLYQYLRDLGRVALLAKALDVFRVIGEATDEGKFGR